MQYMENENIINSINIISLAISAIGGAVAGVFIKFKYSGKGKSKIETETFKPISTASIKQHDCPYTESIKKLSSDVEEVKHDINSINVSLGKVETAQTFIVQKINELRKY